MKRVLVIAPHPDDDLIGCGGSIAKHLKNGNEVFVIYITFGDAECPEFKPEEFTKMRKQETLNAAKALGLKKENLFFLGEKVWRLKRERARFRILELVRQIQPDICYIPHSTETHVDHQIVSQVAFEAIKTAPSKWFSRKKHGFHKIPTILAYEVATPLEDPNYFEDITDFLEIKIKALKEHKTQNIAKHIRICHGINAFRGTMIGKDYAEAFEILRISKLCT